MESPLLEANAIVDLNSSCVGLLNMSRHGLLLKDGGRTLDGSGLTRKRKRPAEASRLLTQRVSNDTPSW